MPVVAPQLDKPKKDTPQTVPDSAAKATAPQDDFAPIRDHFNSAPEAEQKAFLEKLSGDDRTDFATKMGWFGHADSISAPPATGSIPWMKEKAQNFLTWGANQLPTVGGVAGGIVGGAIGGAVTAGGGGEVPGAIVGSGVGGGAGEAGRQYLLNKQGYDKFEDPKTAGSRFKEMAKEGAGQAAGEATGQLLGKWLRPTLERAIGKLYYAGNLKYGNPLGPGDLQTVIDDLVKTEKSGSGKATTVGDFLGVIHQAKKDIGQQVDLQLALPINQSGKMVMLGKATADSSPIVQAIQAKATSDPSIVKLAKLNPAGKEAAYLEHIRKEALNFSQTPWTYEELTDRRIKLNNQLAPLYELPAGEQRVYLLDHPELAVAKDEAEAIRQIVYPKMDSLSGKPKGTTQALQDKRGALMGLEIQATKHLGDLKTKALQAQGAPPLEKVNISTYGTTGSKPGLAVHRLTGLIHTPNPERSADKQVAGSFGNTVGSKFRKAVTSPLGSDKLGNELLSMPLRELVNPSTPQKSDDTPPEPQSSVAPPQSPRELLDKAKRLNPVAQGQMAFNHIAVNPANGHRIGSSDGLRWVDVQTGQQVS